MPTSLLSSCGDGCGWLAACMAIVAWGSFGVPIKHTSVDLHPLVMQSYKTIVCFSTSWLVILLGEEVRWSSWGIVSGLFWVPAAACGIYGIRNAGLSGENAVTDCFLLWFFLTTSCSSVAVGTWSSIVVLTSFFFGIIVFKETVKHIGRAVVAFVLIGVGLVGMSRYSSQQPDGTSKEIPRLSMKRSSIADKSESSASSLSPNKRNPSVTASDLSEFSGHGPIKSVKGIVPLELEPLMDDEDVIMGIHDEALSKDVDHKHPMYKERLVFFSGRISVTRRQMGVLGAVVNGAWGGMNLVPMHYAFRDDGLTGASYLISYGGGSLIVNIGIWIILYAYYLYQKKGRWKEAAECLPNWHFAELWYPGLMAGLLYSLGNFSSILSVTYLGQAMGFSVCQMQLFVSGLWGVFYFHEIKGRETIAKWFLSAGVAVAGIVWLSYEHEGGVVGH